MDFVIVWFAFWIAVVALFYLFAKNEDRKAKRDESLRN